MGGGQFFVWYLNCAINNGSKFTKFKAINNWNKQFYVTYDISCNFLNHKQGTLEPLIKVKNKGT